MGVRIDERGSALSGAGRDWAIVLAAGAGTRLAELTRDGRGRVVPKQFCSLMGAPLVVAQALAPSAPAS